MKHSISIKRTAHYYTQEPSKKTVSILIIIHGYAQLAKEFLREFELLKNHSTLVVAPEALSKFYNKDKNPVANWMTSHEREDEINDYIGYLNLLVLKIRAEHPNISISVVGFSQGVSTLLRWLVQAKIEINKVHLCAGTIPPELTNSDFSLLKHSTFYYYYGVKDKLLKPEKAKEQILSLRKNNLTTIEIPFNGRHEIPQELISFLSS